MKPRNPAVRGVRFLLCVLLSLACAYPAAAQEQVGIYLTWKQDPTTTMTINWVDLHLSSTNILSHRERGSEEWITTEAKQSTVASTTLQLRRVELTGLKPDTMYEFGIGKKAVRASDVWRFRTMPATLDRDIRFVTGGDMMHSREMVDAMNKQAAKLDPDFALLGGDLAYANGVSALRWIDWLQSWMKICIGKDRRLIPMVLTIGNHEVRSVSLPLGLSTPATKAPYFYSLFDLPDNRSYYAMDFGKYLSLVILDSDHTQPIPGKQTDWLKSAMAERAGQAFLFACYHYPAYGTTKAPRGKLPIDASKSITIRKHWMPEFEKYGLSAVFENDHHNYKRTHRLRNHQRDDENGILYLGDGAWGVKVRTVPKPEEAWWLAKAEARNHLWSVDLHKAGTATIRAIDVKGEVFDEVKLATPRTKPVH